MDLNNIPTIFNHSFLIYFLDLAHGWMPTIIDHETEFKFIRLNVAEITDTPSLFVGGSTFGTGPQQAIEYFEYLESSTGTKALKTLELLNIFKIHLNLYVLNESKILHLKHTY